MLKLNLLTLNLLKVRLLKKHKIILYRENHSIEWFFFINVFVAHNILAMNRFYFILFVVLNVVFNSDGTPKILLGVQEQLGNE